MRKTLLVLILALLLAVTLIGCNGPNSADAATKDNSDLLPDEDVACFDKREANMVGQSQPNGDIPDQRPGPAWIPDPNEKLEGIKEPAEEEAVENGAEGETVETFEHGTAVEHLEAAVNNPETGTEAQRDQLGRKLGQIKQTGELPICSGKDHSGIKPAADGEMVVNLETIKERRTIGDDPDAAEVNPLQKGTLASIADIFYDREAQAQTTCDNIAVVKVDTGTSDYNLYSMAMSVSNQLTNHFSPNWGWCVQVGWVTNDVNSVPSGYWPLFVTQNGAWANSHAYYYWPYGYPKRYSPYGIISDAQSGCANCNHLSMGMSHEALEMAANPYTGNYPGWFNTGPGYHVNRSGNADYAWEAADPVWYKNYYPVGNSYNASQWLVSNFVLKSWFRQQAAPWDASAKYRGTTNAVPGPLEADPGTNGFVGYYYPRQVAGNSSDSCKPPDYDGDCWYHPLTGY